MNNNSTEYLEEMVQLYEAIHEREKKREDSIHHTASSLLIAIGCSLSLCTVGIMVLLTSGVRTVSMFDACALIVVLGTLFASLLMTILAQWHMKSSPIADSDGIQIEAQENPEVFKNHEQRLQYRMDLLTRDNHDLQKDNRTLNNRLRGAGITFVTGMGLLVVTAAFLIFKI